MIDVLTPWAEGKWKSRKTGKEHKDKDPSSGRKILLSEVVKIQKE